MNINQFRNLVSERLFYYFQEICRIPRGSGNMKGMREYLEQFALHHELPYYSDAADNVIIYVGASKGYEEKPIVILQGHMDMVCEKTEGYDHDFFKDPIVLQVEDGVLSAKGTTLGGDDGVAVAAMLAIAENDEIPHPALELVFTSDEEIGMLGASLLDMSRLDGRIMINLDNEAEHEILCGCAGGICVNMLLPLSYQEMQADWLEVEIKGLKGGHSGTEIDKIHANSNVLAGRLLYNLDNEIEFALAEMSGGTKDNAIPRFTKMLIGISSDDKQTFMDVIARVEKELQKEYHGSDEAICIVASEMGEQVQPALSPSSLQKVILYLRNIPNGIYKMSGINPGLVETSSNLGILQLLPNGLSSTVGVRSNLSSGKQDLVERLVSFSEFLGARTNLSGAYAEWEFRKESALREQMVRIYRRHYGKEPVVAVMHAGVECSIFVDALPGLDCVSFGPDIFDIHTTEEHMPVDSVDRFYAYLLAVLADF